MCNDHIVEAPSGQNDADKGREGKYSNITISMTLLPEQLSMSSPSVRFVYLTIANRGNSAVVREVAAVDQFSLEAFNHDDPQVKKVPDFIARMGGATFFTK